MKTSTNKKQKTPTEKAVVTTPTVTRTNRVAVEVTTPEGSAIFRLTNLQDNAYRMLNIEVPYNVSIDTGKMTFTFSEGQTTVDIAKSKIYQSIASFISTK